MKVAQYWRSWGSWLLLFGGALVAALSAGYYKQITAYERLYFSADLPMRQEQHLYMDVAQFGAAKYWLQPGYISISSGGRKLKNRTTEPLTVEVELTGVLATARLESTSHVLQRGENGYLLRLGPKESAALRVTTQLPGTAVRQWHIGEGAICFRQAATQQSLGQVLVTLDNSNYREEADLCRERTINGGEG